MMREVTQAWDARCARCGITVGQIVGDRFIHDPDCTLLRRIEGGTLKCCRCGGPLHGTQLALAEHPTAMARTRARR